MFTRRNWLLRCSILINIAVLLYICSHLMIGNSNISLGPAFVMQEDYAVKSQQTASLNRANAAAAIVAANNLNVQQQINDNAHDQQQQQQQSQPQDSPQDAEPEPIVDNDLSQVTFSIFKLCSFVFIFVCVYILKYSNFLHHCKCYYLTVSHILSLTQYPSNIFAMECISNE